MAHRGAQRVRERGEDGSSLLDTREISFDLVVARAVDLVPGCDACALTLQRPAEEPQTVAATDEDVLELDRRQHAVGQSPGLESAQAGDSLLAGDLATDPRWPLWSPRALQHGFWSMLSIGLHGDRAMGALNLYGRTIDAFSDDGVDLAEIYAMHAAEALDAAGLVLGLRTTLRARHVIGIAQGMLAARYDLTYAQAFDALREEAGRSGTTLRHTAERVAAKRGLPTHGS